MIRKLTYAGLFFSLLIISCEKNTIQPTSIQKSNNLANITERSDDAIRGNRSLKISIEVVDGKPKVVDAECVQILGNCLDDVIVTARYIELLKAIELDVQSAFFSQNNYGVIYGINEIPHIQDGLAKGHLKVRIIPFGNVDYNLIIKPQHERFFGEKLEEKAVLVVPVIK